MQLIDSNFESKITNVEFFRIQLYKNFPDKANYWFLVLCVT